MFIIHCSLFMLEDTAYWIGFSKVPGIGPARLRKLLDYFGNVRAAWQAGPGELAAIGLDKRSITSLAKVRQDFDLEAELRQLEALSVTVLTWDDEEYPPLLRNIPNPPFVLYIRGEILTRDQWGLAVVGTRSASIYGKEVTRTLVTGLAASGVTIISGLALGIDTQAHRSALEVNGRTIAVLGCGVDIIYPQQNDKLGQQIIENGALISEFALETKPESGNFPRRNRIISGLSLGVLIVEGAEKSGARITIDYALEQGRETFAVPGNILGRGSKGPNKLIQRGAAKLVTSIGDVLEELNLTMVEQHAEAKEIIPDTPVEAAILEHLSAEPIHVDELGHYTSLPPAELSSTLTMMELKGQVRQVGGMNYVLAREASVRYMVE
ncbi:MAG: DNA-processing protein DprA [Anaerolineae bacterium]